MAKKASSSFRQSVLIDTKRHPELAYLERLTGWGERSAEIVRLARLGAECELQERALLDQFRTTARRRAMAQVNSTAAGIDLPGSRSLETGNDFDPIQPDPPVKDELPAPRPSRRAEPIVQSHVPEEREEQEDAPAGAQAFGSNNSDNSLISQFLR